MPGDGGVHVVEVGYVAVCLLFVQDCQYFHTVK